MRHSHLPSPISHLQPPKGVIALMTVITIGALILAVGISASFVGQTDIIVAGHADREHATRMLASACAEEAMHRLRIDPAYAGGTVPLGTDSCAVTVSGSGSTRTVTAAATVEGYTKTIIIGAALKQNAAANARAWSVDTWTEGDPP